eukprot:TRINITY_DN67562_c4_g1_i1.p1 TRINITY_DN67562_c4_g1~~TRINITY_DN67562_c4_g1_i1.p1  ORF type:complete len:139 (-),score=0.77 TRINITY_DN67562_c4_g1_i1:91-507(-)
MEYIHTNTIKIWTPFTHAPMLIHGRQMDLPWLPATMWFAWWHICSSNFGEFHDVHGYLWRSNVFQRSFVTSKDRNNTWNMFDLSVNIMYLNLVACSNVRPWDVCPNAKPMIKRILVACWWESPPTLGLLEKKVGLVEV